MFKIQKVTVKVTVEFVAVTIKMYLYYRKKIVMYSSMLLKL